MKKFPLAAAFWTMCGTAAAEGSPQAAIELYVDTNTRQIFAEPGPGRQRLGKFVQASDEATPVAGATVAAPRASSASTTASAPVAAGAAVASAAPVAAAKSSAKAWYDKIGI
ncbi:MAG: porin, partial [Luteibacter sp.]